MMQAMHEHEPPRLSSSPSFSSYSSETYAQIADRVIHELQRETNPNSISDHQNDTLFHPWQETETLNFTDDFEFPFVTARDSNSSLVSADDVFYNGQIKPTYPLFDSNLLFETDAITSVPPSPTAVDQTVTVRRHRPPLRKLMFEDRESDSCSSSNSEAEKINNELKGVDEGTYCVWNPKSAALESMTRSCKKSKSTGFSSSKMWKLRELLIRSHGDRKEPLLFFGSSKRTNKVAHEVGPKASSAKNNLAAAAVVSAKEGDQMKRKSLLLNRKELVAHFNDLNGIGRNSHPF